VPGVGEENRPVGLFVEILEQGVDKGGFAGTCRAAEDPGSEPGSGLQDCNIAGIILKSCSPAPNTLNQNKMMTISMTIGYSEIPTPG
jgi:hypothetical protein